MTMKLQGPHNNGGFTHEGICYEPDADGCIDVPGDVATFAFSHGFFHAPESTPSSPSTPDDGMVNFSKLNKKQLVAFAKDNLDLDLDEAKTNKELVSEIEAAMEANA
jgi:hypothetical protein